MYIEKVRVKRWTLMGESLEVGGDKRHPVKGGFDAGAEGVEAGVSDGGSLGGIHNKLVVGNRLLGLHTLENEIRRGRRHGRVNKESKGRIGLVNLNIGVGDTDVRLGDHGITLGAIEDRSLILGRLG